MRDTARRAAEEVLDASVAVPDAELVAPLLVPLAEVAVADALETEAGVAMRSLKKIRYLFILKITCFTYFQAP